MSSLPVGPLRQLAFLLCVACGSDPQDRAAGDDGGANRMELSGELAFDGVNVITMAGPNEEVLVDQIVVVEDGVVVAIVDRDRAELTDVGQVIPAEGTYLIPGLADMHVHYWPDDHEGLLFVAHGVTRVRNMHGLPEHLALGERIAAGELVGPELFTTGPAVDGDPPAQPHMVVLTTPDEARAEVERQAAAGFKAVKVYSGLSPDVYAALSEAAAERDLPLMGHVPDLVGVATAAAVQRSNEHLLTYDLTGQHAAQIATTVDAGMWNCVTLVPADRLTRADILAGTGIEGDQYVSPVVRDLWRATARADLPLAAMHEVTRDLAQAGAGLLAGTDANVAYVVPGSSLHEELERLVGAGLSPYQALRAATYNAASFLDDLARSGTVQEGRIADLVLLDADPLADITNTRRLAGVMVHGTWYPAAELATMLDQVQSGRESAAAERVRAPPALFGPGHAHGASSVR